MKLRHASIAIAFALVGTAAACSHSPRRADWRSPAPPVVCTTDADCQGGTCTLEAGAAQGTCAVEPGHGASPLGGDGGAAPGPAPTIQPSSSDIQL